ncbi:MAG TPA: hypothetical protein VII47_05430 [Actinomycetota bacterium]|jgi:hypothetical protein
MIEVGPNFIARPYREVSVQRVDVPLDPGSIRSFLLGRPVYRRTSFMVLVRGRDRALVQVEKASTVPLFSPVTDVRYLAGPEELVFIEDPGVDTGNAGHLARAALTSGTRGHVYVVQGRYQHVNFIVDPAPVPVRVVEVVPPEPPKLLEMARRVLDYDEDLPPVDLELAPIDLRRLAAGAGASRFLFPCRCSGLELPVPVHFLDSGPPREEPWTLVGCERSRQIHEFLYGRDPAARVEMCPKLVGPAGDAPTLTKCCLIERGIEASASRVVVPWGANLEEVRGALHALVGADAVQPSPTGA